MKAPLSWLRDYVDIDVAPAEIAHRMTLAGIESEGFEVVGEHWDGVAVGLVTAVDPHPNADRLRLATVDTGDGMAQVVCGAPNVAAGQKIAFAREGATLLDAHTGRLSKLKAAKIRGVESRGMVCSERELGLSDEHEGILVLDDDAPLGRPLADHLGDVIFDFSITPNRPDLLSVLGLAREAAALTGGAAREPDLSYAEEGPSAASKTSVEILDPDLCPRYIGAVITGVTIGPSPRWLQERLAAYGSRSINNVVDVTNFVMLEMGQPLHAFDYDRLGENRIVVRRARPDEWITTIDGLPRELDTEMLVIADAEQPVALAGIMGGEDSEVTDTTVNVLLESANFNATNIRRTSQKTELRSEASIRFDKGLSPELPLHAARRALKLIAEVAGGVVAEGLVDAYPGVQPQPPVRLTEARTARVLGAEIPSSEAAGLLARLGFTARPAGEGALDVTAPYWRTDIEIEDDLVEEIARLKGYDWAPTTGLQGRVPDFEPQPILELKVAVQNELRALGLSEIVTYSLTNPEVHAKSRVHDPAALHVVNPLSSEQTELRRSLRGGVLQTLAANARHEDRVLRLFEVGKVYVPRPGDLPDERETLAGGIAGARHDPHWGAEEPAEVDFYDAKGIVDALLAALGAEAEYEAARDPLLHPGRAASVHVGGVPVGLVGEIHPNAARSFDLGDGPCLYFEIDLGTLLDAIPAEQRRYHPLARFPGAVRDLALVVDESLPAARVTGVLEATPLVAEARLFDVYAGDRIAAGKKSLAYHVIWQSPGRTLTNEEVDKAQARLLQRLEKELGAVLRG